MLYIYTCNTLHVFIKVLEFPSNEVRGYSPFCVDFVNIRLNMPVSCNILVFNSDTQFFMDHEYM